MSMSSNDQLNIKPVDYQDENPILQPLLDREPNYGPHTRDTLKALGKGVVDVIKYRDLTEEEKAQGIRGSVTNHILKPSESQDYTKNASYRRAIGAVLKENERNSRGMTLNIYDEEVPLNPPKAKRNLGKMALWSVATTVASYAPSKNRLSAVTSKKVHGADVLVPGKPGASASEARLMYGQGIGYGDIIDAFRTKKKAVKTAKPIEAIPLETEQETPEASQKQPSKAVKAAKSAIKFTARTITNVDRAASKKLMHYVEIGAINQAERKATRLRGQAEALNWQIKSHEQKRDSAGAVSKKSPRQLSKTINRKSIIADWKLANARQEEARAARIRYSRRNSQNRDTL